MFYLYLQSSSASRKPKISNLMFLTLYTEYEAVQKLDT